MFNLKLNNHKLLKAGSKKSIVIIITLIQLEFIKINYGQVFGVILFSFANFAAESSTSFLM